MSKPVPVWQLPSFSSIFADAMIGGTSLDGGHPVDSANALLFALHQITSSPSVDEEQQFETLPQESFATLQKIIEHLQNFSKLAATRVKEPAELLPVLDSLTASITSLPVNSLLLLPGGWSGATSSGTLTHILERTSDTHVSFVTCNGGCSGIEYHPSSSTDTGKLRFKTCIRISEIPLAKVQDKAFWSTHLSLFLKQPAGEYQRGEVVYDVLLPWLADELLPAALAKTENDPRAQWRTPCRSGGSATYKSVWEAVRYLGLHYGLSPKMLKILSLRIRRVLLDAVARDLEVMDDPSSEFQMYKVPSAGGERTVREILQECLPLVCSGGSTTTDLSPLEGEGKILALYFSGSWCGPCQQFTPKLKEFYTSVKREGKTLEIVFISHDRNIEEFQQYFATMPWHALPYTEVGRRAAQEMVEKFQVSGIPTLLLLRGGLDGDSDVSLPLIEDGRGLVEKDPTGQFHPWSEEDLERMRGEGGQEEKEEERTMSSSDLHLIRFACEQTARSATKAFENQRASLDLLSSLKSTVESILAVAETLPPGPDVVLERKSLLPPIVGNGDEGEEKAGAGADAVAANADAQQQVSSGFVNAQLLSGTGMEEKAGAEHQQQSTAIPNTLDLPREVVTLEQALVALVRYSNVVDELLKRAGDASTSSRLASRYQIIEVIGQLFLEVLPVPEPSSVAAAFDQAKKTRDWKEDQEEEAKISAEKSASAAGEASSAAAAAAASAAAAAAQEAVEVARVADAASAAAASASAAAATSAAAAAARQEAALNLMAAYPQYEFDVVVGALEVCGDSISIAANLIFGKDNDTARIAIEAKRASSAAATSDSTAVSSTTTTASALSIIQTEEERLHAQYHDTFGPNRSVATTFRESLAVASTGSTTGSTCLWSTPTVRDSQLRMLQLIQRLLSTYGSMWQALDTPTRAHDAERTCVTMAALSMFDILLRMPATDNPLVVSALLARDGGYAISTAVCQNNRPLGDMSSTMQLHHPTLQRARARALDYLSSIRRSCSKTLFIFRQPQKIEIKKYSSTCVFLKRLLHRCGYPLIPRDVQRPPTEIEALCNWMFEPETPLAQNHPEFGLARDMAALSKFLLTMQTREAELIRRRMDQNRMLNFSFTFEEGGRKSSWELRTKTDVRWEVVGFRGKKFNLCFWLP